MLRPRSARRAPVVTTLALVVMLLGGCSSGSPGAGGTPSGTPGTPRPSRSPGAGSSAPAPGLAASGPLPAIEAGLLPWKLTAPLSRMVVLPASSPAGANPGSGLLVAGGRSGLVQLANGVYHLDTSSGALTPGGTLATPVEDAAGSSAAGSNLVFGGAGPAPTTAVQTLNPGAAATQSSTLPAGRSGVAAATIGSVTYLIGGVSAAGPDADVLAASGAGSFTTVATLPIPVQDAAVAALGGDVYVFGGRAAGGPSDGQPVDTIQRIDPQAHKATVIGQLPLALAAAVAFTAGGNLYLAGGNTDGSVPTSTATPGVGSTQLPASWSAPAVPSGTAAPKTSDLVWAFDPASASVRQAGQLQVPVAYAGVAVLGSSAWLVGGEDAGGIVAAVQVLTPNPAFGTAGALGAGSPYFGDHLLIADRGNDRLLLMDAAMHVTWTYPGPGLPADPLGFYFPDDAFFAKKGSVIISNQEQNNTIIQIGYPSGQVVWSYGHPKKAGAGPGFLSEPDDAYLLPNGQITVADAFNCRVLVIDPGGTVAHQVGTTGKCVHNPPTSMGTPNGDTPLADGNLLVSEITGAWVTEYTPEGQLVWTFHPPIKYPSDPQQVDATPVTNTDHYVVADYSSPGAVLQFTREGQVLSTYRVSLGSPGALDHPSLAELLPNGIYLINDDYNHRMVAIDPATSALVWQYGLTKKPGTGTGMLNTPDGFDLLAPDGSTPTHPYTG